METNARTVTVASEDGGEVEFYWLAGKAPCVVLCHGKAFDRDSFLPLAEELQAREHAVAVLNFRGYGASRPGAQGLEARWWDVLAVASWLERGGYGKTVGLGSSMGGGAVLRAVAERPEQFRGLIMWSTVPVDKTLASRWGALPKLFVASENEPMKEQILNMVQIAPEPKSVLWIPGVRHGQALLTGPDANRVRAAVVNFLQGT